VNKRQLKNNLIAYAIGIPVGVIVGIILFVCKLNIAICILVGLLSTMIAFFISPSIFPKLFKDKDDCNNPNHEVQFNRKKVATVAVSIVVLVCSLVYGLVTCVGFYKIAASEQLIKLGTLGDCQYPDCTNIANNRINLRYNTAVASVYKKILKFENTAHFNVDTNSFSYAPDEKHIIREDVLYLVPESDGSYKIEIQAESHEYIDKGEPITIEYVEILGDYCFDHLDAAEDSLNSEIRAQFYSQNPVFWIMFVIIPAICLVIIIVTLSLKKRKIS
jgi:hypothetical protein